jgi:intermembrane space import and assembly protein 40
MTNDANDADPTTSASDVSVNESFDLAEAAATTGTDDMEKVRKALECPCVSDLRESSCGAAFDTSLTCYMLASEENKGKACVREFVALHQCMVAHAGEFEGFTKELLEHQNVEGPAKVTEAA